jgi:hypothetical protein
MPLKSALVASWPSVDAPGNSILSEWETQVTRELLKWSGFQPQVVLAAHDSYVSKWPQVFTNLKPGGELIPAAVASRQKLLDALAGYDIALTLGPHAMFCLAGETALDTFRGTHIDSPFVAGLQVVPTYAPEIYSRFSWHERPVVVSAMRKACQRYVDRDRAIYIPETVADLYWFSTQFIHTEFAFDVETNRDGRITEFSLAPDSTCCLYVQLEDRAKHSIWSAEDELDIWLWLHWLAQRPDLAWGFHNATYDLTYLDAYGIRPRGHIFDTMLRHHAWQPELEKSLGFLASMHIPTRAWKHLRTKAKKDFNKAGAI